MSKEEPSQLNEGTTKPTKISVMDWAVIIFVVLLVGLTVIPALLTVLKASK
jgi:hypothetical protein